MFFRRLRLKNSIFIHFWHAPNHNAKYFCEFLAILLTKIKQSTRLLTYYNNNIFKNRTKQKIFSSKWSAIFAKKSITSKQIAQKYYKIQKMMWRKMKYRRRQTQTRIWTRNQKNPNPRNPHFWKKSHLSFSFAILYLSWMEENYVTKAINNFVKYINSLMRKHNVSILETTLENFSIKSTLPNVLSARFAWRHHHRVEYICKLSRRFRDYREIYFRNEISTGYLIPL